MVRYKHRYFAVEICVEDRPAHAPFLITWGAIQTAIHRKVQQLHGDFGVAAMGRGLYAKYCNSYTKIIMIRVNHGPHRFVATVLPLIRKLGDAKVQLNILCTKATMRHCFLFIRNHQVKKLESYWNKMKTDEDRIKIREAILDLSSMKDVQTGTS